MIHPEQRFNFFSDYSQMVSCPSCGVQEAHFCKNINVYLRGEAAEQVMNEGHTTYVMWCHLDLKKIVYLIHMRHDS